MGDLYEAYRHESQGYDAGTTDGDYEYNPELGWVLKKGKDYGDNTEKENKDD
jgi:hypothetical protein